MKKGRPKVELELTPEERIQMEAMVRSRNLPYGLVIRTKIVLAAASGLSNNTIAQRLKVSAVTVGKWRQRFVAQRLSGLYDKLRLGRPHRLDKKEVAQLVQKAFTTNPEKDTRWNYRSFAREADVSVATAHRLFRLFGLQPDWQTHSRLFKDPFFAEELKDILKPYMNNKGLYLDVVGLYLDPSDHVLVLGVCVKNQGRTSNFNQSMLPKSLGYLKGIINYDERYGPVALFAAFERVAKQAISQYNPKPRHQELLEFLRHLDRNSPQNLNLHLIIDNRTTRGHAQIEAWLAMRPRYRVHLIATYESWLNQVEFWFRAITRQTAIRHSVFKSVKKSINKIDRLVQHYSRNPGFFIWTATTGSIQAKIQRFC
jgi:putative transposase